MATITVKNLLDVVAGQLQDQASDETKRHWPMSELVQYYNLAVIDIISLNKSARTITEPVKFAAGSKQSVPAKSISFIDMIRNMGTDGKTPGAAIVQTSLQAVAAFNRNWSSETATTEIYNVMPDPDDPRTYYISPPSDGTGWGLLKTSQVPNKVVYDSDGNWESEFVAITDEFLEQLKDKIKEYAYGKDSDFPGNKQRESDVTNQFLQEMAIKNNS